MSPFPDPATGCLSEKFRLWYKYKAGRPAAAAGDPPEHLGHDGPLQPLGQGPLLTTQRAGGGQEVNLGWSRL